MQGGGECFEVGGSAEVRVECLEVEWPVSCLGLGPRLVSWALQEPEFAGGWVRCIDPAIDPAAEPESDADTHKPQRAENVATPANAD